MKVRIIKASIGSLTPGPYKFAEIGVELGVLEYKIKQYDILDWWSYEPWEDHLLGYLLEAVELWGRIEDAER